MRLKRYHLDIAGKDLKSAYEDDRHHHHDRDIVELDPNVYLT